MSWLKPITVDVKEAMVGPVAGGDEQDQEEDGTIDAWPIQKVGQEEERDNESMDSSVC